MSALAQTYPLLQSIFIAWYRNNPANGVGRLDSSSNNAAIVHRTGFPQKAIVSTMPIAFFIRLGTVLALQRYLFRFADRTPFLFLEAHFRGRGLKYRPFAFKSPYAR